MAENQPQHIMDVIERFSRPKRVTDKSLQHRRGEQDLKLRGPLFFAVVGLMLVEVFAMFFMAMCQGFGHFFGAPFELDEWVLMSIQGGVLIQTFGLAGIITHALFYRDN